MKRTLLISLAALFGGVTMQGSLPALAACNQPPVPAPGQSVTWTLANSPYSLCSDLVIPSGGRVTVQPGVEIQALTHTITVQGTFNALGTAAQRIKISASDVFPPAITNSLGSVAIGFADITGQIRPGPGRMSLSDSTFSGNGLIFMDSVLYPYNPPVVSLVRCTFTNSQVFVSDSYVVLADNTFTNTVMDFLRGYVLLKGTNRSTGQPFSITRENKQNYQPMYVDGIAGTDVPTAGGATLKGGNFLLGPNNLLQRNLYGVDIEGGLLPGSVIPTTGNTNNYIMAHGGASQGDMYWANLGLPYVVNGLVNGGGNLTIEPGVTVQFDPLPTGFAGLTFVSTRRLVANGLPNAPITFKGLNPGVPWDGLFFQTNQTEGSYLNWTVVQGAKIGVATDDNYLQINNSLLQGNQVGANSNTYGIVTLSKTRVFGNAQGIQNTVKGSVYLEGGDLLPNWFQGNGRGVNSAIGSNLIPAQNNYWGSPTGPKATTNPSGQGDSVTDNVVFRPFLTAPPDIRRYPPIVKLTSPGVTWRTDTLYRSPDFVLQPGAKVILQWSVQSSQPVTRQQILLSLEGPIFDRGLTAPIVIADNLPGSARSYEFTVPQIPFAPTNLPQFIRVVAYDDAAQLGWDQTPVIVPSGRIQGNIEITSDYSGQTFIGGHQASPLTYSGSTNGEIHEFVFLENDGKLLDVQFPGTSLPILSTDAARMVILSAVNSNDLQYYYSDTYFSIRPDPALGLQPPVVHLVTPQAGDAVPGGSTLSITWTASAQQGLRAFDIQASTDGGKTFHPVVSDLPASARSYGWALPASSGIPDVRVKVIAKDKLFQNSSDGAKVSFSIQ